MVSRQEFDIFETAILSKVSIAKTSISSESIGLTMEFIVHSNLREFRIIHHVLHKKDFPNQEEFMKRIRELSDIVTRPIFVGVSRIKDGIGGIVITKFDNNENIVFPGLGWCIY